MKESDEASASARTTLEITIGRRTIGRRTGDVWPLEVEIRRPGELRQWFDSGVLRLDLDELRRQRGHWHYGTYLGEALFHDRVVRSAFDAAYDHGRRKMRLLLHVHDRRLRQLAWQRLCAPLNPLEPEREDCWKHLVRHPRTPFSLSLPSRASRAFPPIGSADLQALIVVANPPGLEDEGLPRLGDEAALVAGLRTALGPEIRSNVLSTAEVDGRVGRPTLDELCRRLSSQPYSLLHLVAHGLHVPQRGETLLFLEDPRSPDRVDVVTDRVVLERLDEVTALPHFVFLAACESAAPEAEAGDGAAPAESAGGLGQQLVRRLGVPAVVAMTDEVTVPTATALAEGLYRGIRTHGEVDRALVEAVHTLPKRREHTVPALFTRLDGPLWSDSPDRELAAAVGRARELWRSLEALERPLVRDLFLRLVRLGNDADGADRGRRVRFGELVPAGNPPGLTRRLVDRLVGERLLKVVDTPGDDGDSAAARDGDRRYELTFGGLIRAWPRYADWLRQDRELLKRRQDLRRAARAWRRAPAERAGWIEHRGDLLDETEALARLGKLQLNADEQDYLEACARDRRGQARKQRRRVAAFGLLAALAAVAAALALFQGQRAERNARVAEGHAREADRQRQIRFGRQLAARGLALADRRPDQALLLALHANRVAESEPQVSFEARESLLAALNAHPSLGGFLNGHDQTVTAIAWSPDGKTLATASHDERILLWDDTTPGIPRRDPPLVGHDNFVLSLAWSPDSQRLVSGGGDGTVILWDAADHAEIGRLRASDHPAVSVDLRPPAGEILALASGSEILLVDLAVISQPALVRPLDGHQGAVTRVAWSADGRRLLSGGEDGRVILWDPATGAVLDRHGDHAEAVEAVAWSPQGDRRVVSGGREGAVIVWDLDRGRRQPMAERHDGWVLDVAWSRDGEIVASTGRDTTVRLWDADSGQAIGQPFVGHGDPVKSLAFSNDEIFLASGGWGGEILLWDVWTVRQYGVDHGALKREVIVSDNPQKAVAFPPADAHPSKRQPSKLQPSSPEAADLAAADSALLANLDGDHHLFLSHWQEHQHVWQGIHGTSAHQLAWSPDRWTLALGGQDGEILLWDAVAQEQLSAHSAWIHDLAFGPRGRRLASVSEDGCLIEWDLATGAFSVLWESDQPLLSVAWSRDGRWLVTGAVGGVGLWDLGRESGRERPLPLDGPKGSVWALDFHPDGKTLAAAGADQTVLLWDLHELASAWDGETVFQPSGSLTGHTNTIRALAWSPDGRTLASAGQDRVVMLWDLEAGQPLGELASGHLDTIHSLSWSPDGQLLASASEDRTIVVWDLSLEGWRQAACARAGRELTASEWQQFAGPDMAHQPVCPTGGAE